MDGGEVGAIAYFAIAAALSDVIPGLTPLTMAVIGGSFIVGAGIPTGPGREARSGSTARRGSRDPGFSYQSAGQRLMER